MSDWNRPVIDEFRANGGKVGGRFEGSRLLLLTTRGARSGAPHTTPLGFLADGDRYVVIASAAGGPHNPAWYHNVLAYPTVTVELGESTFEATATVPSRPERDSLWTRITASMPGYAEYQQQTDRVIPVVVLTRR